MGTVVVLGSTITDLVARAPRLPLPGESLIGDDFATFLGGKGFNQAIAAARLGANVSFIGCVGTDVFGDAFYSTLSSEGIDSKYLLRDPTVGTGTACVMVGTDTGQNSIIVLPRANHALTVEAVEEAMRSILAQPARERAATSIHKGVIMAQCEMHMATVEAVLRSAHAGGMLTIFNMAPVPREPLRDELFTLTDILIVNESEAASLAGILVDSLERAKAAAEYLLAKGSQHVIITLGALGCLWSTSESGDTRPLHQELRSIAVTQVDATAAGDAFCGALAAKLAEGMSMMEALRWANAAGTVTVTRRGAFPSLPTAQEVEALL